MKVINLWLNKHMDLSLASKLNIDKSYDVLINSEAYAKYPIKNINTIKSPLSFSSNEQLNKYLSYKKSIRMKSRKKILTQIENHLKLVKNNLHLSLISSVYETLRYCEAGCLDAIYLYSSISRKKNKKRKNYNWW